MNPLLCVCVFSVDDPAQHGAKKQKKMMGYTVKIQHSMAH
jgi:hypothetical protein